MPPFGAVVGEIKTDTGALWFVTQRQGRAEIYGERRRLLLYQNAWKRAALRYYAKSVVKYVFEVGRKRRYVVRKVIALFSPNSFEIVLTDKLIGSVAAVV